MGGWELATKKSGTLQNNPLFHRAPLLPAKVSQ